MTSLPRPDRIENRSVRGSTVSEALPWGVNHKDLQGDFDATIEMINELTAQLARLQLHRERVERTLDRQIKAERRILIDDDVLLAPKSSRCEERINRCATNSEP